VSSGLGPLGHDDVNPRPYRPVNVAGATDEGGCDLASLPGLFHRRTGSPDSAGEKVDVAGHDRLQLLLFDLFGTNEAGVILVDELVDEGPVPVGDPGLDGLPAVVFGHAVGQHQIDAERVVTDQ